MRSQRPVTSKAGFAAAVLSGAVAVLYLSLISSGSVTTAGNEVAVGAFAAAFIAIPVCLVAGSLRPGSRAGMALLAAGALGATVLGVLGLASIGLPLLLAAVAAWGAVVGSLRGRDGSCG